MNMKQLDKKLHEMRERGFTGISVFIRDTGSSMEDYAKDTLAMINAMEGAKSMSHYGEINE